MMSIPKSWCVEVTNNSSDTPELLKWRTSLYKISYLYTWWERGYIDNNGVWRADICARNVISYKDFILNVYRKLPENWCVQYKDDNAQYQELIDYLNKFYKKHYVGGVTNAGFYYGVLDGQARFKGTINEIFEKKYCIELTIEEFLQLKNATMEKDGINEKKEYTYTREIAKKLHDAACREWKERIKLLTYDILGEFDTIGAISHSHVKEMFEASHDEDQYNVLKECFPEYMTFPRLIDLSRGEICEVISSKCVCFKEGDYVFRIDTGDFVILNNGVLISDTSVKAHKVKINKLGFGDEISFHFTKR